VEEEYALDSAFPNLADADLAHDAAYFVEEIEAPVGEREVPVHR